MAPAVCDAGLTGFAEASPLLLELDLVPGVGLVVGTVEGFLAAGFVVLPG